MSLSRKDLEKYFRTKDSTLKNAIEQKASDDPFDTDALEGWSASSVPLESMNAIDRKRFKGMYYKFALTSILFFAVSIGFMYFVTTKNEQSATKKITEIKKPNNKSIYKDTITAVNLSPEQELIQPKTIKRNFQLKKENKIDFKPTSIQPDLTTQPLPIKKANSIPASIKRRVNLAKETYIHDFKVVDYRYYRSRPTSNLDKEVLTGTPANSEISTNTSEESENIVEIAYVSFLGKSLKHFSQNKFKDALSRFDLILETYPDDVNALFYSALCHYNLNQFSLCEKKLIELKNAKFTNFDEEQEWYLLLTYYSLHKDEQFLELKSRIIQGGGFYAKKAEKL
jgi:tetratricopeptide (TPR) repeat protein